MSFNAKHRSATALAEVQFSPLTGGLLRSLVLPDIFVLVRRLLSVLDEQPWLATCRSMTYARGVSLSSLAMPFEILFAAAEETDRQRQCSQYKANVGYERGGVDSKARYAVQRYEFGTYKIRILEYDQFLSGTQPNIAGVPTGSAFWNAGRMMCTYFSAKGSRSIRPTDRVLELGAGVGALAIIIALAFGVNVQATDMSDTSLKLIRVNAALNTSALGKNVIDTSWLCFGHIPPSMKCGFDVIVGSDIILAQSSVEGFFKTVSHCLAPKASLFLGHTTRNSCIDEVLFQCASKAGFVWFDVTPPMPTQHMSIKTLPPVLWQFSKK